MGNTIKRKQQDLETILFRGYLNTLFGNIQLAIENFEETLKICEELGYREEETNANLWLGHAYQLKKKYQLAIKYYNTALICAKKHGYELQEIEANLRLAYIMLSDEFEYGSSHSSEFYHEALSSFKMSLPMCVAYNEYDLSPSEDYERQRAERFFGLGDFRRLKNQLEDALLCYGKALQFAKRRENKLLETKAYLRLGRAYNLKNDFLTAINNFERALEIEKQQKDEELEKIKAHVGLESAHYFKQLPKVFENLLEGQQAEAYLGLGNAYRLNNELQPAIEYYEKVLEIAKEWKAKRPETKKCHIEEAVHDICNDFVTSNTKITYINKIFEALKIVDKTDRNDLKVKASQHLVNIFTATSEYKKPIEHYQKARDTSPGIDADEMEVIAYQWLGYNHLEAGQYKESIKCYKEVANLASRLGDNKREITAYLGLGSASSNTGDFESSESYFLKALTFAEKLDAKNLQREAYTNLGHVCYKNCHFDKAVQFYLKAQKISQDLRDRKEEAHACLMLGNTFQQLKQIQKAIESYQKALTISYDLQDKEMQAKAVHGLGSSFFNTGQYEEALKYSKTFVELIDNPDNNGMEQVLAQKRLGMCYSYLERFEESLTCFKKALEIIRKHPKKAREGTGKCQLNQAIEDSFGMTGDKEKSKECCQKAMKIAFEIGDKNCVGSSFFKLALVCSKDCDEMAIEWFEKADNGDYEKAKEYYQEAKEIAKEIKNEYLEGTACLFLASVCRKNADYEIAIKWYEQAYDTSLKGKDHLLREKALTGLGVSWFDLGNVQQAIHWLQEAQKLNKEQAKTAMS